MNHLTAQRPVAPQEEASCRGQAIGSSKPCGVVLSPDPYPEISAFYSAFDLLSAHIAVIRGDGSIAFVNRAWIQFAATNGHGNPEGFIGTNYIDACGKANTSAAPGLSPVESKPAVAGAGIRAILSGARTSFSFEYACATPSEVLWFLLSVTPAQVLDGPGAVVAHTDITKHKVAEDRAWQQANHDALTGLPNRQLALDRLEQAIRRCQREGTTGALLFIDLDRFKPINDAFGHAAGDQVLCDVAQRIRSVVRESDTVARLSGDEFLVIAPTVDDGPKARALAEKIRTAIDRPFVFDRVTVSSTASVGVGLFPNDGEKPCEVILAADRDMYRQKSSSR